MIDHPTIGTVAMGDTEAEAAILREALLAIQSAQSTNHGCMATILADISKIAAAALSARPAQEPVAPFMYGIMEPDGTAYMDEVCVDLSPGTLEELIEEGEMDGYKVVPLYLAAPQPVLSQPEVKAETYDIASEQRWASALFEFMCDFGMIEVNFNGLTLERALEILRENYACDEGHHSDDLAVDRFAAAMKAKLAEKRAQGYGGWDDPNDCTIEHLNDLLIKHIAKGDPLDVGNFAMMIHQRGGRVAR